MNLNFDNPWNFLFVGYGLTVAIETPVLLLGLRGAGGWRARLFYGLWLTACTYPIVVLVLPPLMADCPRWQYLLVAETFATGAECLLFWSAQRGITSETRTPRSSLWDFAAIVAANATSFAAGLCLVG